MQNNAPNGYGIILTKNQVGHGMFVDGNIYPDAGAIIDQKNYTIYNPIFNLNISEKVVTENTQRFTLRNSNHEKSIFFDNSEAVEPL